MRHKTLIETLDEYSQVLLRSMALGGVPSALVLILTNL